MATYKSIKYVIPVEAVEHTDSINALSDVDTVTTAPADGQILKWNNADSKWYPGNSGGGSGESSASGIQKAIFGFGDGMTSNYNYTSFKTTNLVSSTGVVAANNTGVGSERGSLGAASYGGDKAIFGFGDAGTYYLGGVGKTNITNLVSNTGIVSSDVTGVGSARSSTTASGYGEDKAIFGFGRTNSDSYANVTNLVSNSGVVASDTTGVGTARRQLAAARYGDDKALFGFGRFSGGRTSITNLISNLGVVATDTTGVPTGKSGAAAAGFGGDKAIFAFGYDTEKTSTSSLVSNTGVVSSERTGVGTGRTTPGAAGYGGDKAIFGFGSKRNNPNLTQITNLISNTGIVSSDISNSGLQVRDSLAAAGYSTTA